MKLIDKDALLAEIDKAIDEPAPSHDQQCEWEDGYYGGLYKAESIIDTLEVKEVDLKREIDKIWDNTSDAFSEDGWKEFEEIAKYFFELGLKAQKGEEL